MTPGGAAGPAIRPYEPGDATAWDDLVSRSRNGTFLHSRRFLSYHGDRSLVVSHPGLTYGGVVHDGSVRGESMIRPGHRTRRLNRRLIRQAHSYCMVAAAMSLGLHGCGNHAVRSGAGGTRVTKVAPPRCPPNG